MQTSLADFFSSPRASSLSKNALLDRTPRRCKSTPRRRPRPKLKSIGNGNLQQTIIDAGQSKFGLEHCIQCGMVYSLNDSNDVQQHDQFHNRFIEIRNFKVTLNQIETWKESLHHELVQTPVDGILFLLPATSTATLKRKLEELLAKSINDEVSYSADLPFWDLNKQRKAFVFIATSTGSAKSAYIAGLLMVDPVQEVILTGPRGGELKRFKGSFIGVDRIWVHSCVRRKGLATFMLDSARRLLVGADEKELPKTRVAFSDPCGLGIQLACSYIGDKENGRFITYNSMDNLSATRRTSNLVKKLTLS